jgi:predicted RNA-binding protein YlqC (UPF0109 family)
METSVHGGDIVVYKVAVPDVAIGHVVGKKGRNINVVRGMPGVYTAVLDMRDATAVLVVMVSGSGLDAVVSYVSAKLAAGQQAKDVIERRWTAIQQASCEESVDVPFHLARFVLKKDGKQGLEYLRGCDGIVHVDWDSRGEIGRNSGQLRIWAKREDALHRAVAWTIRQMRMGEALLLGKVVDRLAPTSKLSGKVL